METDDAIRLLWEIADKPERMRVFDKIVSDIGVSDPQTFWINFWEIWESSENLHADHEYLTRLLRHGATLGHSRIAEDAKESEYFEALPFEVIIFRGGIPANENGWSWTTDINKAEFFARRAVGDERRQVVQGRVLKPDVLAVLLGRGESEIVVLPEHVHDRRIVMEWTQPVTKIEQLIYDIHAGNDAFGDATLSAKWKASQVKPAETAAVIALIKKRLAFAEWAGLSSVVYYQTIIDELSGTHPLANA